MKKTKHSSLAYYTTLFTILAVTIIIATNFFASDNDKRELSLILNSLLNNAQKQELSLAELKRTAEIVLLENGVDLNQSIQEYKNLTFGIDLFSSEDQLIRFHPTGDVVKINENGINSAVGISASEFIFNPENISVNVFDGDCTYVTTVNIHIDSSSNEMNAVYEIEENRKNAELYDFSGLVDIPVESETYTSNLLVECSVA